MSHYREIRLRLNLEHPRDRWLSHALDETVEELGAPVASVVRRAMIAYLRGRVTGRLTAGSVTPSREGVDRQASDVSGSRSTDAQQDAGVPRDKNDPWLSDREAAKLVDTLVSIGTPRRGPEASS